MSRQARVPGGVGGTNVEGLNIVIGPGITVKGHLRAEGDSATVDLSNVRLSLQTREIRRHYVRPHGARQAERGAFSLTGLTPGEYKAYAWEDIEIGAYMDPDFMKPIEEKGEAVSLQKGEQKTLTLKVIPVVPL